MGLHVRVRHHETVRNTMGQPDEPHRTAPHEAVAPSQGTPLQPKTKKKETPTHNETSIGRKGCPHILPFSP